jgi:hypothetical protein
MDDRDRVATVGGTLSYRAGPLQGSAGVTRGLNDRAGTLGTARIAVAIPFRRLIAIAGTSATYADAKQMRRDFGVSEIEASRRQTLIDGGDDRLEGNDGFAYRPDGGLRQIGGSLTLHAALGGPKDLFWTQGAHIAFYDKDPYVAKVVDAAAAHFGRTLSKP